MALPKAPTLPEFFVYRLEVGRAPFYVGIGRSERAADRVRYVKYMMRRAVQGRPVKWSLSTRVIAGLLQRQFEVKVVYRRKGLVRRDALDSERNEIARLIRKGCRLANVQHNTMRPKDHNEVLRPLLALLRTRRAGLSARERPHNNQMQRTRSAPWPGRRRGPRR